MFTHFALQRIAGSSASEVNNATHIYTKLGVYTITGIAMNAIGNTTIQYIVVVQIPVSPSNFVVISTAPVVFPTGQYSTA
jgi:PKD repeat protein